MRRDVVADDRLHRREDGVAPRAELDGAVVDPARDAGVDERLGGRGPVHGGGDDFVVSRAEFDAIFPKRHPFYTYDGFVDALGAYPAFASTGTPETRTREAAAFLTHADFESVGLRYVKEINEANYWIKCDDEQPFGCPAGQTAYYGRGPIMFSWNFNYKAAGDALGIDLLNDPWLVEEDPSVAWQTALWYWNTQNGPGVMTSHQAMVSGAGFGQTINSLNGALRVRRRQPGVGAVARGPLRADHRGAGRGPGLGPDLLSGPDRGVGGRSAAARPAA